MNDKQFKEWLRYSQEQQRQIQQHPEQDPPPERLQQLTQAELNRLHGLPDDYTPPTDQDVQNAVNEVLADIAPHRLKAPVMARGKTMQNTCYDTFNVYGTLQQMPEQQQDVFTGLCRAPLTDSDNTTFSPQMMFMLLKTQQRLNAERISDWLNVKRSLRGWPVVTIKHARAIVQKLQNIVDVWRLYGFEMQNVTSEDFDYQIPD